MRINNNISALNAWRGLTQTDNSLSKSLEKLSSGLRINRAADDAAGLAISEKMRGQIRGLNQAVRNAQDGISLIQTAEGALTETHAILQRMRELAVQSANDTNTDEDRAQLQKEFDQLTAELDRIATTTEFNTKSLLNGDRSGVTTAVDGSAKVVKDIRTAATVTVADATKVTTTDSFRLKIVNGSTADTVKIEVESALGASVTAVDNVDTSSGTTAIDLGNGVTLTIDNTKLQLNDEIVVDTSAYQAANDTDNSLRMHIGANNGQNIAVAIGSMTAEALGLKSGLNNLKIDSQFKASATISFVDKALESVSSERSKLGAMQNRLEHTIKNLGVAAENLAAAESRIRDVDMAQEMMNFTKQNILMQAGTAMLAQANARPQSVLQLLG